MNEKSSKMELFTGRDKVVLKRKFKGFTVGFKKGVRGYIGKGVVSIQQHTNFSNALVGKSISYTFQKFFHIQGIGKEYLEKENICIHQKNIERTTFSIANTEHMLDVIIW